MSRMKRKMLATMATAIVSSTNQKKLVESSASLIILLNPIGVNVAADVSSVLSYLLEESYDLDEQVDFGQQDKLENERMTVEHGGGPVDDFETNEKNHGDYYSSQGQIAPSAMFGSPDTTNQNTNNFKFNSFEPVYNVISHQVHRWFNFSPIRDLPIFSFQNILQFRKQSFGSIVRPTRKGESLLNMKKERIGAWCPSASTSDEADAIDDRHAVCQMAPVRNLKAMSDVALEDCELNKIVESADDNIDEDEVQAGMVLYVLPSGAYNDAPSFTADSSDKAISNFNENTFEPITGTRCLVEMGQRYDTDERVVQYALVQRLAHELGNVDMHEKDFAYQPVILQNIETDGHGVFGGPYGHKTHEIETRISPESEALEPVASFRTDYYLPDSSNKSTNDQQLSYRWWSWFSHFTNIIHNNSDLKKKGTVAPTARDNKSAYKSSLYEEDGKRAFAGGSHGEIWQAKRRCPRGAFHCEDGKDYIIKRLKIELGFSILEAGLREVYFGEMLSRHVESSNLVTTYIDHFFREGKRGQLEFWIVFENAGPSLRSYLYTPVIDLTGSFIVYQHSSFWRRLRKSIRVHHETNVDKDSFAVEIISPIKQLQQEEANKNYVQSASETNSLLNENRRNSSKKDEQIVHHDILGSQMALKIILKQILTSVAFLHERGIVHRDIKPSNVMCKTEPQTKQGMIPRKIKQIRCVLGDFSSAWDEYSDRNLYINNPSSKEQSDEYAPPEVLIQEHSSWSPFFLRNPYSYDSWSIGVVALEMLLGSPNVFSVDQRTTAILTNRLHKEGANSTEIQRAMYLAALSQYCIYVPTETQGKRWPLRKGDPLYDVKVVKETCTVRDFHNALRARDPLGTGFDESTDMLLHLIWRLLAWDPLQRISPSEALLHPFFSSHKSSNNCYESNCDEIVHGSIFSDLTVAGPHNALETQLLDPKIDMNSSTLPVSEFFCPKCHKKYFDLNSCQQHARFRRHASFCTYDRSALPHCLNAHTMLPTHSLSGYCDIQGHRRSIEDFHTVHLFSDIQFYGVFDGHSGNLASKYAASSFYQVVEGVLSKIDQNIKFANPDWKDQLKSDLEQAFEDIHEGILNAVMSSPGNVMDESGTTATILGVTELAVVIANVGDSRAVLSHWSHNSERNGFVTARQLTVDHIASSHDEQIQVVERKGFISESGGIDRVNGVLAVSRSLGDLKLAKYLSRIPHVFAMTKKELYVECGISHEDKNRQPCFIILASDGLWDVMSNQEAVDMVLEVVNINVSGTAFQEAAELLTQEAFVRGSSDNIGVCVVAVT